MVHVERSIYDDVTLPTLSLFEFVEGDTPNVLGIAQTAEETAINQGIVVEMEF